MRKPALTKSITLADRAQAIQQARMTPQIPKFSILATTESVVAAG